MSPLSEEQDNWLSPERKTSIHLPEIQQAPTNSSRQSNGISSLKSIIAYQNKTLDTASDDNQIQRTSLKFMKKLTPLEVNGKVLVDMNRQVLWRQDAMIRCDDKYMEECVVEFSKTKNKFFIVCYSQDSEKFHVIEMFRAQAMKLMANLGHSFTKLIEQLEFLFDKLIFKQFHDLLCAQESVKSTERNLIDTKQGFWN